MKVVPLPSIALIGAAAIVLGLGITAPLDPVATVISDYGLAAPTAAYYLLSIALLVLGGTAAFSGLPLGAEFRLWQAGLALCALFPTNKTSVDITFTGELHRIGGGLALVCLPLASRHVARTLGAAQVGPWTATAIAASVLFGLAQFAWTPLIDVRGLLERIALGAQIGLLLVIAHAPRRRLA
ncbi:DUF998 domain-containing protein [Lentzea sp. NPDC058436]|uniref:DUF998 domain-containing protein n=1 Tax=Lentzea sp. NPDC058436 TaxID=3346499 RepID=UPI00365F6769